MSEELKQCREAFEAWYAKKYLGVHLEGLKRCGDGYEQLDTHYCWLGWQEAWNTRAADAQVKALVEALPRKGIGYE